MWYSIVEQMFGRAKSGMFDWIGVKGRSRKENTESSMSNNKESNMNSSREMEGVQRNVYKYTEQEFER